MISFSDFKQSLKEEKILRRFYSILFYSILFYSILFYSILFYSILFYSILFLVPSRGCNLITSENKCFSYFSHPSINWYDARVYCQTWGGDLASIASAGENAAVDSIRSSSAVGSCWIGLNDIGTEGIFVWSDGSSSSYRNWDGGAPNNVGNEDCVHVGPNIWNDLPCNNIHLCYYCSLSNGE